MAWPLIRVNLSDQSPDFQKVALQPGFPVLDRFGANAGVLRKWIGRFAAEAVWDDQSVRFLWQDDENGSQPESVLPATIGDLRGALKSEVDLLQSRLKQAVPTTSTERLLWELMTQRFELARSGDAKNSKSLFKARIDGTCKLVWCWGFEQRHSNQSPLSICNDEQCRLAFIGDSRKAQQCPRCGKKVRKQRSRLRLPLVVMAVLLLTGFLAWQNGFRLFPDSSALIEGIIVDEVSGQPIVEATVEQSTDPPHRRTTDNQGRFTIPISGRHRDLQISKPGYLATSWSPPQDQSAAKNRITLRGESEVEGLVVERGTERPISFPSVHIATSGHNADGDEVGMFHIPFLPSGAVDFEIFAKGYKPLRVTNELKPGKSKDLLLSLVGAATAHGAVVDAFNKQPIAGAVVKVANLNTESITDSNGNFLQHELPGSECHFEVSAPGYFTREFNRQLAPSGESKLRFLLRPNFATVDGDVVDSVGAPIANATVRVPGVETSTTTSPNGSFQIAQVRHGIQQLEIAALGYPTRTVDLAVPLSAPDAARIVLTGDTTLTGTVTDKRRKMPLKDVEIRVLDGRWKTRTNENGQYVIKDLPRGNYTMTAIGRGYESAQTEATTTSGDTRVDLVLQGATVVSGYVKSQFDQRPIQGATVTLEGLEAPQLTDQEGRFRFEGVETGSAKLKASASGYQLESRSCETQADRETEVSFELRGTARLSVKVVADDSGAPLADAEIGVVGTNRKWKTNAQGEFKQDGCPAEPMTLDIEAKGFVTQRRDCNLKSDSPEQLTIRMQTPNLIGGVVVDARTQQPVVGATVSIAGVDGSTTSDSTGRFRARTAPAKMYEFKVEASGYPSQSFVEQSTKENQQDGKTLNQSAAVTDFLLRLSRDSEVATESRDQSPNQMVIASAHLSDSAANGKLPSDQFGPTPRRTRDAQDVEFFGIRTNAMNIGYAVDRSGSMQGRKLHRTILELLYSVIDLHPKQSFYVAFFADNAMEMFGDAKSPVHATPTIKVKTYRWAMGIDSDSGTNPTPAMELLASFDPQTIFLLSDGIFDPLPESLYDELLKKKIRVNTIAFEDQSGIAGLTLIATRTQGKYRFVPQADVPPLTEVSLATRYFEQLLEYRFDPSTDASEIADAHNELKVFCDGQDMGPGADANAAQIRAAKENWRRWWVENKLVPQLAQLELTSLMKELMNQNFWWRWAAVESLDKRRIADHGVFIQKILDSETYVQQAARRALARRAGDEDYGPELGANSDAIRAATEKWKEWLSREKYIEGMKKKSDDLVLLEFQNPDVKIRRAAVQLVESKSSCAKPQLLILRLTDVDLQIRQSARDALTKITGQRLGPTDCTEMSQCEAAAKEWSRLLYSKQEVEAEKMMRLAESLISNNRTDTAMEWYRRVVEKFPNTQSAAKAAAKLKETRK